MISSRRRRFQDLVVSIQQAFLDTSGLRLTLSQARRRFSADATTCSAVLNVLVEAGVLMRTSTGQYARLLPRTAATPNLLPQAADLHV